MRGDPSDRRSAPRRRLIPQPCASIASLSLTNDIISKNTEKNLQLNLSRQIFRRPGEDQSI